MITPENFVYWLQGFFEIADAKEVTPAQVEMIKKHLGYVFATQPAVPVQIQQTPYRVTTPYTGDLIGDLLTHPPVFTC